MARNDIDGTGWLVEDKDSNVVKAFAHTSAWEKAARPVPMTANTVEVPRIEDMDVDVIPKGGAYGEDQSGADVVSISAAKFGKALRIAEEDVDDTKLADYIDAKKTSAASSFAKKFDNAAIGTTAARNGLTVPFDSLYHVLTTADASTGYAANDNVLSGASLTYDLISELIAIAEGSDYYDESQITAIAHPAFRRVLRELKDGQQRPLFLTDIVGGRSIDRVLGVPIEWSNGAKTSATAVTNNAAPGGAKGAAGNPLFAIVNRPYAIVGNRSPLESVVIPGRDGLAALTDEDIVKVRVRKAAGITMPSAHALFERTSA